MKRIERLRRVGNILETQERGARRAMAKANDELRQATADLEAVLDQCERLIRPGDGQRASEPTLPVVVSAAIVQAGLREAGNRAETIETATEAAEERQRIWREANRRQEAVDRLVDRWREEEEMEADKRNNDGLDEVITARGHRPGPAHPGKEVRR